MKKFKIQYLLIGLLISSSGCKKVLDINQDPTQLTNSSLELQLPSGMGYSAGSLAGVYQILGGLWAQHYTQNNTSSQYRTEDAYGVTYSDAGYNRAWNNLWAGGINDLNSVRTQAQSTGKWNFYIASTVMMAFDYHILADFYGAIPIQGSLQGAQNTKPVYTEGKAVNTYIIALLDDAISKSASATSLPSLGKSDYVFGGDIAKWVQFAKTLKLKLLMRDFATNQAQIQTMLTAGGFLTVDAKMDVFEDKENYSNPFFENDKRKLNTDVNLKASNTIITFLKANSDPRISDFFYPTGTGSYAGLEQGDYSVPGTTIPTDASSIAKVEATDPVYLLSAAESEFLQAEAWARLSNPVNAKTHYDLGTTLAFARWGKSAAPFIAPGGKYAFPLAASVETMIKTIITQKWVSSVRTQDWDAFFDQNRTGYPLISTKTATTDPGYVPGEYIISANSVLDPGEIPRRLLYPKSSSDYNPNTPPVVDINQKMWWHK